MILDLTLFGVAAFLLATVYPLGGVLVAVFGLTFTLMARGR